MARSRAWAVRVTQDWFRALMDSAPEVYFRYAFAPARRFAYVSRAVESLTGYAPDAFYADPTFCVSLVPREDRPVLRQIVRARRPLICTLRLTRRDGILVRVGIRTVPVIRDRKVVAVEGIAAATDGSLVHGVTNASEPVQQRLAALLYEVHDILHGTLAPRETTPVTARPPATTTIADIAIDSERMAVTIGGKSVMLTTREFLLLHYFLHRPGRVVTRKQLLAEVWGYRYSGDDRTVDVHLSRLRHKLPPLRRLLRAVKHVGYILEPGDRTPRSGDVRIARS